MRFWRNWPYWLKGGVVVGEGDKLPWADIVLIFGMSVVLAILTFLSNAAYFYELERGGTLLHFLQYAFRTPYLIGLYPLIFLFSSQLDPDGSALGIAILATYLSPVVALLWWLCIFYVLTKISIKFSSGASFLARNGISLTLFALISLPYAYYLVGNNAINVCLGGELNVTKYNLQWDTASCFKSIAEREVGYGDVGSEKAVNFCKRLSDKKLVVETDSELQYSYPRPRNLTFQDYCLYTLAPLPPQELCEVIGRDNMEEREGCLGFFSWIQRPRSNFDVVTTPIQFSPIESTGEVVYTVNPFEVTLAAGNGANANSWIYGLTHTPQGVNFIEFDARFSNAKTAEALLSVYISDERVAQFDGKGYADGVHHLEFEFPAYKPGMSGLGFRLDTFAKGIASVKITGMKFGFKEYEGVFDVPHRSI